MPFTDDDIASDQLQSNSTPGHRVRHNNINAALRELFTQVYDAREYGALPTSGSDELAHLQDAIDACAAAGGGILRLLAGVYLVSDRLDISTNGVIIEGAGKESTIIRRTGSSTSSVIRIQTDDGAADKISNCGVRRLTIDGIDAANYGLRVKTARSLDINQVLVQGSSVSQVLMDCWDDRPVGGDARDNQRCDIRNLDLICTGSADGMTLTGNSDAAVTAGDGANTSLNTFANIFVQVINGDAFLLKNCDGNDFTHLQCYHPSGSGRGLVLSGSTLASGGHTRNNRFFGIQMGNASGVYALANTTDSGPNRIWGLSKGNGGTAPTISAGATLYWEADDGTGNI